MKRHEIRRPDDWHLHLRDDDILAAVALHSARDFGRALIMPNLMPPVATVSQALAYRERIEKVLPRDSGFEPRMTLYLTETSSADDIAAGFGDGLITAVKLYPAGATTNSQSGVADIFRVGGVLQRVAEIGMPLCVHGEVTDPAVDIFDREAVFIDRVLAPLRKRLPELRVVMEHVTTSDGVDYVLSEDRNIAATITPHHLMLNRNALLAGGIRPHYYCLPVVKRETHRQALRKAATSGDDRFFLGTDSAPHTVGTKECRCGCAGIFSAPNAMACCAHVFDQEGRLDRLEGFVSLHGAAFYGEEPATETIVLEKGMEPAAFPEVVMAGAEEIRVFEPTEQVLWRVLDESGFFDATLVPERRKI